MKQKKIWGRASIEVQNAAIEIVRREEQARYEEDKVDVLKAYQLEAELGAGAALPPQVMRPPIAGGSNALASRDADDGDDDGEDGEDGEDEEDEGDKEDEDDEDGEDSKDGEDDEDDKDSEDGEDNEDD